MANSMNNFTTLIKRLEAATSRLEDMVPNYGDTSAILNGEPPLPDSGLDAATGTDQKRGNNSPERVIEPLPPAIEDFDAIINGVVQTFVSMSEDIGGLVAEQSAALLKAFTAQRKFLLVTTKAKKPDIQSPAYREVLKELQSTMGSVNDIREANRGSPLFNHLTTVSEGVEVLGWITIEPKPANCITDTLGSAEFYGNRVLKEYKEKDRAHVEWVQAFYQIFKSLTTYIEQHYRTGVTWNNRDGIDALDALHEIETYSSSAISSVAPAPAPPPPPPPPPPPLPSFESSSPSPVNGVASVPADSGTSDMGAVFDQISRGEAVTSRLRKVSPSSQTHKNPSLRANDPVLARSDSQTSLSSRGKSPHPSKKPKPESMRTKKPPRKELDGNKWIIENFDAPSEMIKVNASISHSVLISRCSKTRIQVVGKANAISLDNCTQCSLVIDSLVSAVDVIKSPKFELQVLGTLPTIMLDQVDTASIYLSRESLGTEIFTSKCTAVNINLPGRTNDDDYEEKALPEQIKSVVRDGVLVSEIVEHCG